MCNRTCTEDSSTTFHIDEHGNFLANEQTVSHSLVIVRRDLMKEARVAHGFYPVVVSIRADKLTGRGKVIPQVSNM